MGGNCCREIRDINLDSAKLMKAITKDSLGVDQMFIQVYDMENETGNEIEINLRFLKLAGLSQLNINNSLFLCGWDNEKSSDHAGSTFIRIDPMKQPANVSYLVSSSHCHCYPSMTVFKDEYIIIVGGKGSLKCEIFNMKLLKWRDLPDLPEERFKCILASDEVNNSIYLFGGYNSKSNKIHSSILKINLKNGPRWETIVVTSNYAALVTKADACVCSVDKNTILIVGGQTNNEEVESSDIIECSFMTKSGVNVKNKLKMNRPCLFESVNLARIFNGNYFLIDNDSMVHKISNVDQKHSYKSFFNNDSDEFRSTDF